MSRPAVSNDAVAATVAKEVRAGDLLDPVALRRFGRESILLLVALGLLNGSNYLFHIAVSRQLGPSEYGALAALLAVAMVLSVPFGVVQTVVAQRTASLRPVGRGSEAGSVAAETMKALVPVAALAALVMLVVGTPALALFLHVDALSASLFAPYTFISLLASVPLGSLQGSMRFPALAGASLAGVVIRLGAGIGLVAAGLGVPGAMLATVLAQVTTLALGVGLLNVSRAAWRASRWTLDHVRGDFRGALLALTSFWLLAEIDIALARHYLGADAAGFYSAGGLVARALLFLPAAVAIVAFPRFAEARHGSTAEAARWLRLSLLSVAALVFFALPFLVILREPVVSVAFGERFLPGAGLVPLLALAMGLLALVNVLVYFHVAMGSKAYRLVFAAVALEAVLIGLFHETPEQIATIVVAVSGLVAALQYHAATAVCRWRPDPVAKDAVALPLSAPSTLDFSVVLPCHNAGAGLRDVLRRLGHGLEGVGSYEVIVVSDGSTDGTVSIAGEFEGNGVRTLQYPLRSGKGQALRVGLAEARGRYVAFLDADGDIGPEALRPFLALMKLYEPDIVLGSKRHPLSEVYYPPLRRILSWTYHKLTRALFRVNVRDTQTGMKLIRRDVLVRVLPTMLEKRYAFDLELLVVARRLGFKRVFEAPIRIEYQFASQVDVHATYRILLDTLAIFYRRYVLDSYGSARTAPKERLAVESSTARVNEASRNGHRAPPRRGHAMRVLFLNWRDVRNPDAGGAEVFTHEVAKRWAKQGHQVTLLTSRFPNAPALEVVDGVRIRRVGRLRTGSFHALVQRELARVRNVDVVVDEINTVPFLTPVWRARLPPVVALIHQLAADVWDAEVPRPLAGLGRWLEPHALRLYRDVPMVTVSNSTKQDLEDLGLSNVSVIPNGRDEPPPLNGTCKEPEPTFLFVGRLAANKRPDHAVAAFRAIRESIPAARLWIVGRGPLERVLSRELPEGAEVLGHLPRDDLYLRMARAHCLLVPSVREGWGLVVVEANSVGTPAVGYDVPGVRDSIRDGRTGLLAEAGIPNDLGRRALTVVTDPRLARKLGREAEAWSKTFSWDVTSTKLMEAIQTNVNMPQAVGMERTCAGVEVER